MSDVLPLLHLMPQLNRQAGRAPYGRKEEGRRWRKLEGNLDKEKEQNNQNDHYFFGLFVLF